MDNKHTVQINTSMDEMLESKAFVQLDVSSKTDNLIRLPTIADLRILARILLSVDQPKITNEKIVDISLPIENIAA
ncbi:hypothetical protein [Chitinophaga sancti]|uniref:Uncharacterized protein n=2 Tax=Chitinophaga sancti TaxID=1004 RepID=A0ABZ0XC12_9BACT|nr:hypothetical protein [Chitinophaga sancti]WQD59914.1 hypothetical protein U0033_18660 [Chitinophaga sancti]WQG87956.1 hypothetical protein SR876_23805 [Chitinophaga sancti]